MLKLTVTLGQLNAIFPADTAYVYDIANGSVNSLFISPGTSFPLLFTLCEDVDEATFISTRPASRRVEKIEE